jgi:hypothetical protein
MKRCMLLTALAIGLAGCAAPLRFATLEATPDSPAPANLVLGSSVYDARLATLLTERSDWPSVSNGYQVDDVTMYFTTTYDVQSHYDRFGALYYEAQSFRSGVRVR